MNNFDVVLQQAFVGFDGTPWHLDCIEVMCYLDGVEYDRTHESELRVEINNKKLLILEEADHQQLILIISHDGEICTWQIAPYEFNFHKLEETIGFMEEEINIMLGNS